MAAQLTIGREYFETIYEHTDDPWNFETSWYESRKFSLTMAALTKPRYRRVFEPGCAIGVLSEQLAQRCDELLCLEWMPKIAEVARKRLDTYPHASVHVGAIPESWPEGRFDLVMLSEVAYYLTDHGLAESLRRLRGCLQPGGELVSVHYALDTSYPLAGAEVQSALQACDWLNHIGSYEETSFSLMVFRG